MAESDQSGNPSETQNQLLARSVELSPTGQVFQAPAPENEAVLFISDQVGQTELRVRGTLRTGGPPILSIHNPKVMFGGIPLAIGGKPTEPQTIIISEEALSTNEIRILELPNTGGQISIVLEENPFPYSPGDNWRVSAKADMPIGVVVRYVPEAEMTEIPVALAPLSQRGRNPDGQKATHPAKIESFIPQRPLEGPKLLKGPEPGLDKMLPFDQSSIVYGSTELASPDHPIEDGHFVQKIMQGNKSVGVRLISVDGSGGSLNGPDKSQKIAEKVARIIQLLKAQNRVGAKAALDNVNRSAIAEQAQNAAYAGVVVVDLYQISSNEGSKPKLTVASRGDHSVVVWNPNGYEHRRGENWNGDRGANSTFQSVYEPSNVAYKGRTGLGLKTGELEDSPYSSAIQSWVGQPGGIETAEVTLDLKSGNNEYLLILSDGARGSGTLLDTTTSYSQEVNQIMNSLHSNTIDVNQAAQLITRAARKIPDERDDVTVQIVKLP